MKRTDRAVALLLLMAACGGDAQGPAPVDVIDRQIFIETYVDLRVAAVTSPEFRVSESQREEILARHGVDAESLLRFAEAHGPDLDYMNAVWVEIETLLEARAAEAAPAEAAPR